jgi:hypothetical protein
MKKFHESESYATKRLRNFLIRLNCSYDNSPELIWGHTVSNISNRSVSNARTRNQGQLSAHKRHKETKGYIFYILCTQLT